MTPIDLGAGWFLVFSPRREPAGLVAPPLADARHIRVDVQVHVHVGDLIDVATDGEMPVDARPTALVDFIERKRAIDRRTRVGDDNGADDGGDEHHTTPESA